MANWGRISSRGDVEDRRGFRPAALGGISLTGVLVLLAVNYLTGGSALDVLNQMSQVSVENRQVVDKTYDGNDSYEEFSSIVLGSTNDLWKSIFSQQRKTYSSPKLVLFRTATQSGCGIATSDVGPHYCSIDKTIYLDETFFDELTKRFGAQGGDVAEAYVIAHEAGHHAQNELGIMDKGTSIDTELQADCFAGLWANSIKDQGVFLPGEIHEAMDAAAAVGDDRIQEKVNGYVNPENWTHGSSEARVQAFNKGYNSGMLSGCDF